MNKNEVLALIEEAFRLFDPYHITAAKALTLDRWSEQHGNTSDTQIQEPRPYPL